MLKYILLVLAVSVVPLTKSFAADTKETLPTIVWDKTFEDATAKAKTTGKPILLDFFAPT